MDKARRKLPIDWSELELAADSGAALVEHYLDLESGEVLPVTDETRTLYESVLEETGRSQDEFSEADLSTLEMGLQGWEVEALRVLLKIQAGPNRYAAVPKTDKRDAYGDMEEFIETVEPAQVRERLEVAIKGKGAFRRFRETLLGYPEVRTAWFVFKGQRIRARLAGWLSDCGIEPLE